jgi:transcriptional regulator with XRE-family HTH domain
MPEIGATLREARMRARIDISEIESETKIRAKYLRALENEEWDLLPGPTYVKSFLRTYAEALDLDARMLMEEYKLRHERLSDQELQPIAPRAGRERRPQPRGVPRGAVVGTVLVALVAALWLLGRDTGGNGRRTGTSTVVRPAPAPAPSGYATGKGKGDSTGGGRHAPSMLSLRLQPTANVYVCLKAGNKVLIREQTLTPTSPRRTYRATSFRILLGNGNLTMRVNGKMRTVPQSAQPIAYRITKRGDRQSIPASPGTICS